MKNVIFGQQKMFFRQNVSRTLFLYIDFRAACKKWAISDGPILRSCFFVPDFAGSQAELLAIRGPSPNGKDFAEKKISGHLADKFAPCGAIWHTSSKGMPRHAHGRWALTRVCGVDVTDAML